jgi:hypothetical protein
MYRFEWSWARVVGILTRPRAERSGFQVRSGKTISLLGLIDPRILGIPGFFPGGGIKQQERQFKASPPSSVAGKNEWKYKCAPPYAFMVRTETNSIYFSGHVLCSRSDMSHMIIGLNDFCISRTEQIVVFFKIYELI